MKLATVNRRLKTAVIGHHFLRATRPRDLRSTIRGEVGPSMRTLLNGVLLLAAASIGRADTIYSFTAPAEAPNGRVFVWNSVDWSLDGPPLFSETLGPAGQYVPPAPFVVPQSELFDVQGPTDPDVTLAEVTIFFGGLNYPTGCLQDPSLSDGCPLYVAEVEETYTEAGTSPTPVSFTFPVPAAWSPSGTYYDGSGYVLTVTDTDTAPELPSTMLFGVGLLGLSILPKVPRSVSRVLSECWPRSPLCAPSARV